MPYPHVHSTTTIQADDAATNAVPWTTARCNRLLRPIATAIAALRRIKEERTFAQSQGQSQGITARKPILKRKREAQEGDGEWIPSGCGFGAGRGKKRVKKYGRKRIHTHNSAHGGRDVKHPLYHHSVATALDLDKPLVSAAHTCASVPDTAAASPEFTPHDKHHQHPDLETHHALTRLQTAWQNLLKATTTTTSSSSLSTPPLSTKPATTTLPSRFQSRPHARPSNHNHNPRSLFATTLRALPQYITHHSNLLREQNPDDRTDVASEVYQDLEDVLATVPGAGYRPLREVVLGHGCAMVVEAVGEGLIPAGGVEGLGKGAVEWGRGDLGARILEAALVGGLGEAATGERREGQSGVMRWSNERLWSLLGKCGGEVVEFRVLKEVLREGKGLVGGLRGLVVGSRRVWSKVVGSFLGDERHAKYHEACNLLQTLVGVACGLSRDTSTATALEHGEKYATTLKTIMASILDELLVRALDDPEITPRISRVLERCLIPLVDHIRHNYDPTAEEEEATTTFLCTTLLLRTLSPSLSTYLSLDHILATLGRLFQHTTSNTHSTHPLETLPSRILDTTSTLAHRRSCAVFPILRDFVNRLHTYAEERPTTSPATAGFLARLALDTGYAFLATHSHSRTHPTAEHAAWLLQLERRLTCPSTSISSVSTTTNDVPSGSRAKGEEATPQRRSSSRLEMPTGLLANGITPARQRGVRWDEGFAEWVVATPWSVVPASVSAAAAKDMLNGQPESQPKSRVKRQQISQQKTEMKTQSSTPAMPRPLAVKRGLAERETNGAVKGVENETKREKKSKPSRWILDCVLVSTPPTKNLPLTSTTDTAALAEHRVLRKRSFRKADILKLREAFPTPISKRLRRRRDSGWAETASDTELTSNVEIYVDPETEAKEEEEKDELALLTPKSTSPLRPISSERVNVLAGVNRLVGMAKRAALDEESEDELSFGF